MSMSELRSVRAALERLPAQCRYHGDDFGKAGYLGPRDGGEPRCESCRPAWRRTTGLDALERVEGRMTVLLAIENSVTSRSHPIDRARCSAVFDSRSLGVEIPCRREVGHGGDHITDDVSGAIEWPS